MKNCNVLFRLLIISILIFSCSSNNSKSELILADSNGRMNQVLVVMDHEFWKGVEGEELKKSLKSDVYGLPQKEPVFDVTQVEVKAFSKLFKRMKNILIVGLGTELEYSVQTNVYAQPQTIIKLIAPTKEVLLEKIKEKNDEIVQVLRKSDIKAVQYRLRKKQFNTNKLKTLKNLEVDMQIPSSYKLVDDTGDFLWLRQYIRDQQTMNLLVYELPLNSTADEEGNNILKARDTIGKKHIPGAKEGMYMMTEAAYTPQILSTKIDGKKAYQTRGKWEVKDAFMAGPFLSYTVVDKPNNRLVVVEGFTYAPASNKRDYMFEIEAVLKTLKIN